MVRGNQPITYFDVLFNDIRDDNGVQNNEALRECSKLRRGEEPKTKIGQSLVRDF